MDRKYRLAHKEWLALCVQEPGDFMMTFPFALHSGANLGFNLAIAANFGDVEWLELGMESQVKLPLTNLLRQFRPDLLKKYLTSPCLLPPPGHPRSIMQLKLKPLEKNISTVTERLQQESCEVVTKRVKVSKMGRTLHCPGCEKTFVDNKINRLKEHVKKMHSNDEENLYRIIIAMYVKKPKTKLMFICKVCSKPLRGSSTHVKMHHLKEHPQVPYEGAEKA
ncbi:Lysine-specific demethylase 4 [Frankliniella fusca]|uniref:Lysine-specific demethylase 4 n=1 Tax=Frankliniella fusca TaxID=407009 RepID=A0AAE1HMX4_9NEOP|nr:Lysine-specific demethylase 4 [Frankliniella fusca]